MAGFSVTSPYQRNRGIRDQQLLQSARPTGSTSGFRTEGGQRLIGRYTQPNVITTYGGGAGEGGRRQLQQQIDWQPYGGAGGDGGGDGGGSGGEASAGLAAVSPSSVLNAWRGSLLPREAQVAEMPRIDDTDAWKAAYGRAKDTAGQQGRAAMNALMDVQGARGLVGSGLGVNEAGGLISGVASQLSDVNREQMIQSFGNERERQLANLQSRLTQRQQNVGQRGQDYSQLPSVAALYNLRTPISPFPSGSPIVRSLY